MSPHPPVVVMGVSGSGKSTIGAALAERQGVPFADADDFHPPANIAKMSAGHPLDDDDRRPWLAAIGTWLDAHPDGGVVTCSALKRAYRDALREHCPDLRLVHLRAERALLAQRQGDRPGHFMPASLLDSQLETLEAPDVDEHAVEIDVAPPVPEVVAAVAAGLRALVETTGGSR